jgi:hypothetical protein
MAVQRYETRLDRFEYTLRIYIAQLGTDSRAETFPALVEHQSYQLPIEPDFWNPLRADKTLVGRVTPIDEEPTHRHKVIAIADIIVRFKDSLGCSDQGIRFTLAELSPYGQSARDL